MLLSRAISFIKRLTGSGDFKVGAHFRKIYEQNLFGGIESRSGTGSSLKQTESLRQKLPQMILELGIKSFLDAPCGDCHWIAELDWEKITYIGADVVEELILANQSRLAHRKMSFLVADLCADALPRADLIFCRDCWVHLTFRQARACLRNFRCSDATYLLATTFPSIVHNDDLGPGEIWRPLNLEKPPFSFPRPQRLLLENCTEDNGRYADKALGLWRLPDLVEATR